MNIAEELKNYTYGMLITQRTTYLIFYYKNYYYLIEDFYNEYMSTPVKYYNFAIRAIENGHLDYTDEYYGLLSWEESCTIKKFATLDTSSYTIKEVVFTKRIPVYYKED